MDHPLPSRAESGPRCIPTLIVTALGGATLHSVFSQWLSEEGRVTWGTCGGRNTQRVCLIDEIELLLEREWGRPRPPPQGLILLSPKVKCWGIKRCNQEKSFSTTIWVIMAQSRILRVYSKHLAALFHPGPPFSLVKRSLTEDTIVFQRKAEMTCE